MKKLSTSEILWSHTYTKNVELFLKLQPSRDFNFSDDVLMVTFTLDPEPAKVMVTDDEVLEFLVRDNLSSISDMRAIIHYGEEALT